jgi:hypothetical protein
MDRVPLSLGEKVAGAARRMREFPPPDGAGARRARPLVPDPSLIARRETDLLQNARWGEGSRAVGAADE